MFSGPPDQPLLNIEAIRNPESTEDDVTAGVRVTGTADAPKLEVFSDPAKSQQEALSYLLRGGLEQLRRRRQRHDLDVNRHGGCTKWSTCG